MINKIKDLEQTIDVYQNEIKTKRNQLDSLHPKLNQIMQVSVKWVIIFMLKYNK